MALPMEWWQLGEFCVACKCWHRSRKPKALVFIYSSTASLFYADHQLEVSLLKDDSSYLNSCFPYYHSILFRVQVYPRKAPFKLNCHNIVTVSFTTILTQHFSPQYCHNWQRNNIVTKSLQHYRKIGSTLSHLHNMSEHWLNSLNIVTTSCQHCYDIVTALAMKCQYLLWRYCEQMPHGFSTGLRPRPRPHVSVFIHFPMYM